VQPREPRPRLNRQIHLLRRIPNFATLCVLYIQLEGGITPHQAMTTTSSLLWLLGAAFIASSTFLLLLKQGRRDVLLKRLHLRRRRASGSNTPPRSLSPYKKQQDDSTPDYSDIYPPSRRHVLAEIPGIAVELAKSRDQVIAHPEKKENVPLATELSDAKKSMLTPCGFSVEEIDALGNFPDYAKLSGVPLPQPYHNFDIGRAKPRPYRPFRWAYHQTMCK
jgi:hypothetical protein